MRIAHLITTFIAVLAAVLIARCSALANNSYSARLSAEPSSDTTHSLHEEYIPNSHQWHKIVKRESVNDVFDCCPSVTEMVEPEGGKNVDGEYVNLYRSGNYTQRFYELSCLKGVENKPCQFVDRKMQNMSRCVQKFSYSYALVSDKSETRGHINVASFPKSGWMLDYIEVRSGCACEVFHPKTRHHLRNRNKERKRLQQQQSSQQNVPQTHQQSNQLSQQQIRQQNRQQLRQTPRQQLHQQQRQNGRHRQLSRA